MKHASGVSFVTVVAAALLAALSCGDEANGADPAVNAAHADAAAAANVPASSSDASARQDAASRVPRVNAILVGEDVVPLYRVSPKGKAIGFLLPDAELRAIDEHGKELWRAATPPGTNALVGGFDFDQDGWPDVAAISATATGGTCNSASAPVQEERVTLFAGRNGASESPVPPLLNCYPATPATVDYSTRWAQAAILFGAGPELAFAPVYYHQGWFTRFTKDGWTPNPFYQPTGAWWQQSTGGSYNTPYAPNSTYSNLSHVFNGVVKRIGNTTHLVAWTTQRVMDFDANAALGAPQLLHEYPYITGCPQGPAPGPACGGGALALSGRNYGLVVSDPASERVFLIAGTDSSTVHDDIVTGTICTSAQTGGAKDCWGGLERHVSVYLPTSNGIQDRFFSVSHDDGSGLAVDTAGEIASWYRGRVIYAANALVRTKAGPSRIAYNVYNHAPDGQAGHWYLHVSAAGATDDAVVIRDRFLWDIRDIDDDGVEEWMTSPVCDPMPCPDSSGWYFPRRQIDIGAWDDGKQALEPKRTLRGVIPYQVATFRTPNTSTSRANLYPVLTVSVKGQPKLLLTRDGKRVEVEP